MCEAFKDNNKIFISVGLMELDNQEVLCKINEEDNGVIVETSLADKLDFIARGLVVCRLLLQ